MSLERLKAAVAKATPGPWTAVDEFVRIDGGWFLAEAKLPKDADLIVLLRNHADTLIATAEAAKEALGYFDSHEEDAALVILDNDVREALARLEDA